MIRSQGPLAAPGEPWKVQDVLNWLISLGLAEYVPIFRGQGVDGLALIKMRLKDIASLPVPVCFAMIGKMASKS